MRIRESLEYRMWRRSVYERDHFTCVFCGATKVPLEADHIKPFALFPELRFAIDNGRTLCKPCHRTTSTFGRNTK
jgi:5-methylcytosine-specific restriction endonuclease McrA